MKIKIEDHGRFIVYILAGSMDDQWAKKFNRRILFELEEKAGVYRRRFDVILDMAGISALSDAAAGALKEISRNLEKQEIGLAVCKLEPEIAAVFKKTDALPEEKIFPSIFAAELALSAIRNE